MQCSDQENTSSDEEIHEAIDTILAEDKREKSARKRKLAEREAAAAAKESEERDVLSMIALTYNYFLVVCDYIITSLCYTCYDCDSNLKC